MSIYLSVGHTARVALTFRFSDFHNFSMKSSGPFLAEKLGNDGTDHSISFGSFPSLIAI